MLIETSKRLVELLQVHRCSIVFCESCTAGLAAAALGRFPGVSQVLAGGLVVYQTATKHDWLKVNQQLLDDPSIGPVSEQVTCELARAVLGFTPSATLAVAITGHLGPAASIANYHLDRSAEGDGTIFIALATRLQPEVRCHRSQLQLPTPSSTSDHEARYQRQAEATVLAYQLVIDHLTAQPLTTMPTSHKH